MGICCGCIRTGRDIQFNAVGYNDIDYNNKITRWLLHSSHLRRRLLNSLLSRGGATWGGIISKKRKSITQESELMGISLVRSSSRYVMLRRRDSDSNMCTGNWEHGQTGIHISKTTFCKLDCWRNEGGLRGDNCGV